MNNDKDLYKMIVVVCGAVLMVELAGLVYVIHSKRHDSSAAQQTTQSNDSEVQSTDTPPDEAETEQLTQNYADTPASQIEQTQRSAYGDTAHQSYWYCWDTGAPRPHHLGHHVNGDHYCTDNELHSAGMAGY